MHSGNISCLKLIPTVPPNSMTQTSAGPSFPSTGMIDTDSIQFLMASVMWWTTWNSSTLGSSNFLVHNLGILNKTVKRTSPELSCQDNHLFFPFQGQTVKEDNQVNSLSKAHIPKTQDWNFRIQSKQRLVTWYIFPVVILLSLVRVTSKNRS